jgi:hypothetical protein
MSHAGCKKLAGALAIGWCVAMSASLAWAGPAVSRSFDGPDNSWQLLNTGIPAQILAQECIPGGAHDSRGIERIVVAAAAGQSALLVCPIPQVAVLDELQVGLWVRSGRADIQLAARVILPRSLDLQKRSAATTLIRGSVYNRPDHWQELRVANAPKLLAEQVRVMRATPGATIDSREAYIDAVVLIVPGNPNGMEIGTDELTVEGVLLSAGEGIARPPTNPVKGARTTEQTLSLQAIGGGRQNAAATRESGTAARSHSAVRLQGTTLLVDGKPFLPRIIAWNGESLQFLSGCGFNVVEFRSAPTAEQASDAERYGLWFLCPPSHPDELEPGKLGRPGDRVLAWHLQDDALEVDPSYAMRWAELVRERDAVFGRPVVITPRPNWATTDKAADILIAKHPRTGLMSHDDLHSWLEVCPQKARPGTPLWVSVATQSDDGIRRQVGALTRSAAPPMCVDAHQLESTVQIASAHGARGFVFQSNSSLSETDEPTKRRAAALQLINRRLKMMEPWLAAGKVVEQVTSADWTENGVLLYVDRARLLVMLPNENPDRPKITSKSSRLTSNEIVFTLPGVPESCQVFYLSPSTMRLLASERIAGGTKITLPVASDGLVLITEDPQVIQSMRQRVSRDGPKTIQIERDLAVQRAHVLASGGQKLAQLGYNSELVAREIAAINQQIAQLDSLFTSGQLEQAHVVAEGVMQSLERAAADEHSAAATPATFESNPLAASLDTLPEFAAVQRSIESMRPGENLLVGGDFEDLGQMTQQGWQHVAGPVADVQTAAQLSAVEPKHGSYCLELNATAKSAKQSMAMGSDLVRIVSPAMAASANQIVEISGWLRVDTPFAGNDGLEISDSLGGSALSLVVRQTSGWQPFRMIRAASEAGQFRINFILTGLGSAKIDAVMVRPFAQPIARRLPPAAPAGPAAAISTAGTTGPGLMAPPTR